MKKPKVKIRKVWRINPRTRVKESEKVYSRRKVKAQVRDIIKEKRDET